MEPVYFWVLLLFCAISFFAGRDSLKKRFIGVKDVKLDFMPMFQSKTECCLALSTPHEVFELFAGKLVVRSRDSEQRQEFKDINLKTVRFISQICDGGNHTPPLLAKPFRACPDSLSIHIVFTVHDGREHKFPLNGGSDVCSVMDNR